MKRRDGAVAAALAFGTIASSWALAAASNSVGLPRTDDWAFARVALHLHATGQLQLVGWGEMTLVGLVAWAQPWLAVFGPHQWALDVSASALVAGGIAAAFVLARRVLSPGRAALAVACVLVAPGFLRDASAFMTDAPAFALEVLCLLVGAVALGADGRRRVALRWLSLGIGVCAFSVRELAVAAPLAVVAAELTLAPRERRRLAAPAVTTAAACGALWGWRRSLPGSQSLAGHPHWLAGCAFVVAAGVALSLTVAPALAATARLWWRPRHRAGRIGGALLGTGFLGLLPAYAAQAHSAVFWFPGDYLNQRGLNGDEITLGLRSALVPAVPWIALVVLALASFVVVSALLGESAACAWRRRLLLDARSNDDVGRTITLLTAFAGTSVVVLVAALVENAALFDRYLWPLELAGAVLVLARHPGADATLAPTSRRGVSSSRPAPATRAVVGLVLAANGALALALGANADAFDGARWQAATRLVTSGVRPSAVDGGFEWVGSHTSAAADARRASATANRSWWVHMLGLPAPCAVVASSPVSLPGYHRIGTERWRPLLLAGSASLLVYERGGPGCH